MSALDKQRIHQDERIRCIQQPFIECADTRIKANAQAADGRFGETRTAEFLSDCRHLAGRYTLNHHFHERQDKRLFATLVALEDVWREAAVSGLRHQQVNGPNPRVQRARPMTVADLMTHRAGLAYAFTSTGPIAHAHQDKLGSPLVNPMTPDEWLKALGELPLSIQAKLLRALETKRLVRIGDSRERQIDFRLIAATNRKLQEEAQQGRFRQDLYFRLSTAVLVLPPLRDRKRELPLLARAFLGAACAQLSKPAMILSPAALAQLGRYAWPGNVRELRNAMQFAAATATESVLAPWHLPEQMRTAAPGLPDNVPPQARQSLHQIAASALRLPVGDKLAAVEAAVVAAAMKQAGGNKTQAARLLGVHRKSIERKTR